MNDLTENTSETPPLVAPPSHADWRDNFRRLRVGEVIEANDIVIVQGECVHVRSASVGWTVLGQREADRCGMPVDVIFRRKKRAKRKTPNPAMAGKETMNNSTLVECNVTKLVSRFRRPVALNSENHVGIWPLCDHRPILSDPRGPLYSLSPGWTLAGWCKAPFPSSREYNDALVMEYDPREGDDADREYGIYWIHCRLERMNFKQIGKK